MARVERNAAATRKRILDAAEDEFATHGFQGARLREIARVAAVQTALIHHYFEDKQGLYGAVLDRAIVPISDRSNAILDEAGTFDAIVGGFVDLMTSFYAEHRRLLALLRHELASGSSPFADLLRATSAPILARIEAVVAAEQAKGNVRADVPVLEMIVLVLSAAAFPFADAEAVSAMLPGGVPATPEALAERQRSLRLLLAAAFRPPR